MKTKIHPNRIFRNFTRLQRTCWLAVFLLTFLLSASSSWGQITQRGSATTASAATTNNTTISINKPSGVVAGDVLIFSVVQNETDNDNGGLASPTLTGWTLVKDVLIRSDGTSNGSNAWFGSIYYRVSDGTEGNTFSFQMHSRCDMAIGSMVAFTGVACNALKPNGTTGGPFDIVPGNFNNANSSTATATGVNVANNGSAIIMFAMCNNDRTYSLWSNSQSELFDNVTTDGDDASLGAAWRSSINSGSTGNGTVTLSGSDRNSAIFLVLRRASAFSVGTPSSTPTLCQNTTLTNITHSTVGATGIGEATGLPSGVSAAWASNNITISGTPSASGTFNYSIPLIGGCGSVDATGTITVNPSPNSVTASATENSICSGNSTSLSTTFSYAPSSASNSVSLSSSIPDNDQTIGVTSQITLPATCASANEVSSVTLNISHTWVADLDIYLVSPNGTQLALITDKGGSGDNIIATLQTGGNVLPTSNTSISGTYAPQSPFSNFSGSATGVWTLRVFDDEAPDLGTLNSWSITVNSETCGVMTYSWSPATGLSSSTVENPTASPNVTTNYTVTVTPSNGCSVTSSPVTITVTNPPSAGTLSGAQAICSNGTTTFSSTVSGGAWTSDNTAVATINSATGVVTPVAVGTATMTYTVTGTDGCSNATATRTVTVTAPPSAGTLSGAQTICSNGTTTFGSSVSGGAWTSGNTAVATINSATGVVTPGAAGTATMTYTVTGTGGCANATATRTVTITAAPSAGTLSGTQSICSNGTTTFASTVSGGAWTSGNTAVATINSATGVVTPVTAGTATMTYTVTGTGGCSNATATRTVTVTAAPSAGTLSGTQSICSNGTTTFASTVSGGAWTSGNTAVATINSATGVVTPVAAGTATMTYTVTGTGGCANATATRTVTVTAAPSAGTLSGTQTICSNGTTTFGSSVSGGAWTSGNTAVATINSASGVVTPVTSGTATMTYTVTGTGGCANSTATRTVTVSPFSVGGSVSGTATICSGATSGLLTLSGHTGNVIRWESAVSPFTTWTPIANTATTYTSDALTQETKFRAVVQNGACTEAYSSAATLSFASTTWNGTSWVGGEPAANKALTIAANYTSPGSNYDLQGCSLTVQNNAVVTIVPQDSVILSGELTVTTGSTMTFEAKAHLIQSGTTNLNSGTVIVKANSSPIKRLDYTLWSAPVAGQQMQAFSPLTLANRFYNYDSNTNFYTVVTSPSTTSFETAKGVLIRVANTHSASQPQSWTGTFTGVPNSGTYTIPLANFGPGKRFTLVGNPYPSPIDPEAFITNPNNAAAITGTLYLWRKTNGSNKPSYCTFNMGGFASNGEDRANEVANLPYQVIQAGQGFFVEGTGSGSGNVVFDNTMRIDDHTNSFLRTANTAHSPNTVERNRIWLNVTNAAGAFSQAMIGYVTNATNGFDMNYDGKYINDGEIALASVLDAEPYAIQCKALPFSTSDVIPMQFTATTAGTYSIAVDRVDGLFASGQAVYLRDTVTGTVHNLSDGAYSFATESGTFNARFEVVFQASTLGVTDPVLTENQVVIYKTPSNEISINTGNFVMDHVMIYDLAGRLLFQQKDINNSQALIKVGFATEVLLVKIKTQDGKSVTKKVLFPRTTLKKDIKISTIQVAEDE